MFPIHEKGLVSEQSHYQSTRTVQANVRIFSALLGSILGLRSVALIPGTVAVPWDKSGNQSVPFKVCSTFVIYVSKMCHLFGSR
jgi:hypothetical protein